MLSSPSNAQSLGGTIGGYVPIFKKGSIFKTGPSASLLVGNEDISDRYRMIFDVGIRNMQTVEDTICFMAVINTGRGTTAPAIKIISNYFAIPISFYTDYRLNNNDISPFLGLSFGVELSYVNVIEELPYISTRTSGLSGGGNIGARLGLSWIPNNNAMEVFISTGYKGVFDAAIGTYSLFEISAGARYFFY